MEKIFVNKIYEEKGITNGLALLNKTVEIDLLMMLGKEKIAEIKDIALTNETNGGVHFTVRWHQLIAFVQIRTTDGSIKFVDFKNDIDKALDVFLDYTKNGWDEKDKDKMMKLFQEIQNDTSNNLVEMVIVDSVQ